MKHCIENKNGTVLQTKELGSKLRIINLFQMNWMND